MQPAPTALGSAHRWPAAGRSRAPAPAAPIGAWHCAAQRLCGMVMVGEQVWAAVMVWRCMQQGSCKACGTNCDIQAPVQPSCAADVDQAHPTAALWRRSSAPAGPAGQGCPHATVCGQRLPPPGWWPSGRVSCTRRATSSPSGSALDEAWAAVPLPALRRAGVRRSALTQFNYAWPATVKAFGRA